MKADRQLTEAAHFQEDKSYVCPDGREILHGKDWKRRVEELRVRSGGRCENLFIRINDDQFEEHIRCRREARDPHHKTLRSVKRDDRLEALLAVCGPCHEMLDREQRKTRPKP
jgi:hypothetical protein